ncbi:hypothetical protein ACYFX5_10410 [Bremerella sp. T1]|uniref:hypothetical protein n=1 Tax=Bremerella sp. TYQ1 TaxID=3119568 RepID=UPI001CCE1DA8|nr:hypothetical protein [Bremerella volcania]UBM38661.1 hypothetical protein LA756_12355 [Bremerella volcania]
MSQLDRAFIRAYTSEQHGPTADATASMVEPVMNQSQSSQQTPSASVRTMTRKPTLSELQHWKNQGIRIDMPGSPLVGSYDESSASENGAGEPTQDEFELAAKNTAAVSEALDRLMARAGRKHTPVHPVSASKPAAEKADLPTPTVEIDQWEPQSTEAAAQETEEGFTFVTNTLPTSSAAEVEESTDEAPAAEPVATPAPAYRQRRLAHPKWETETLAWPEETDMILDLCQDQWESLANSISGSVKSLALVSLGEGCGCSTMTACLAKLLASQNRRVLIIDEGSGTESLTVRLGLAEGYPADTEPAETLYEGMIQAADQPIAILPAGYRQLGDLSANELQQFASDFDVVLWDGGDRPEVWQRLALLNSVLVVRDARGTHDQELSQILPKLQQRKINVIGIADNFWR